MMEEAAAHVQCAVAEPRGESDLEAAVRAANADTSGSERAFPKIAVIRLCSRGQQREDSDEKEKMDGHSKCNTKRWQSR
jgi:hypothetical protein